MRIRDKKQALSFAGLHALRDLGRVPARAHAQALRNPG